MTAPFITPELVKRCERLWADHHATRLAHTAEIPGNPKGITIRRYGGAAALRATGSPGHVWSNRVINLGAAEAEHLDDLLAFYREVGIRGYLEVNPATASEELLRGLARRGADQIGFHTVTCGPATADVPLPAPGVRIDPVQPDEIDLFVQVWAEGFGYSGSSADRPWPFGRPNWHFYLARVDGTPGGAAVLYIQDGMGYMASASTLPDWRGRGCQSALLHRRVADAAAAGCDLVMGQCAFGSVSQRNQEKAGLRVAYTKAIWATGDRA